MPNRYGDEDDRGVVLMFGGHGQNSSDSGTPPSSFSTILLLGVGAVARHAWQRGVGRELGY